MKLVLASASPRRFELMQAEGYEFSVDVADIDENLDIKEPDKLVMSLAAEKAAHVARKYKSQDVIIIGADTVVVKDDIIMGKPRDLNHARQMLEILSGTAHRVYTGYACACAKTGKLISKFAYTTVYFNKLSDKEISDYIATNEPLGKAGAYAIQGTGGKFVEHIEGEYSCVVGLPMDALGKMLVEEFGFERGK